MKNTYFVTRFILLSLSSLLFFGCSKDSPIEDKPTGKAGISMKINGETWTSSMTTMFTEEHETSEHGNYHYVYLNGSRTIEKNSDTEDDLAESFGVYITIPASKLRNPNGTYPILLEEIKPNHAWAIFASATDIRDASTYIPASSKQSVGSLEITGFEIGQQSILGYDSGTEGYTKLSGTFHMELSPLEETGSLLKITEGTFNLKNGISIDL